MPQPTYTPLATVTLGASAATVTFSSIPATYRDLVLVANGATTNAANGNIRIRFNSDSGVNYSSIRMLASTDGVLGGTNLTDSSVTEVLGAPPRSGLIIFQIMDYSITNKHKIILNRSSFGNTYVAARATRWANTLAITNFSITAVSGDLAATTTFNLYGIKG